MKDTIKNIPISELHPFPENPFSVREDTELQDSIRDYGVISPLVVRPLETGGYEIISGHRRKAACESVKNASPKCRGSTRVSRPRLSKKPSYCKRSYEV